MLATLHHASSRLAASGTCLALRTFDGWTLVSVSNSTLGFKDGVDHGEFKLGSNSLNACWGRLPPVIATQVHFSSNPSDVYIRPRKATDPFSADLNSASSSIAILCDDGVTYVIPGTLLHRETGAREPVFVTAKVRFPLDKDHSQVDGSDLLAQAVGLRLENPALRACALGTVSCAGVEGPMQLAGGSHAAWSLLATAGLRKARDDDTRMLRDAVATFVMYLDRFDVEALTFTRDRLAAAVRLLQPELRARSLEFKFAGHALYLDVTAEKELLRERRVFGGYVAADLTSMKSYGGRLWRFRSAALGGISLQDLFLDVLLSMAIEEPSSFASVARGDLCGLGELLFSTSSSRMK